MTIQRRPKRPWVLSPAAAARKRRLERWLKRAHLSQAALAAELGVSAAPVALILSGRRNPSLPLAKRLQAITGIPATEFTRPTAA